MGLVTQITSLVLKSRHNRYINGWKQTNKHTMTNLLRNVPTVVEFDGQQQQIANQNIQNQIDKLKTVILYLVKDGSVVSVKAQTANSRVGLAKFMAKCPANTVIAKSYTIGDNLPKNILADFCIEANAALDALDE